MLPRISPQVVWRDVKTNRNAYFMAAASSFGGMLFGWDTGLIGGVLEMDSFKHSFNLQGYSSSRYSDLSGNIVSVLQAGCFFGALSSMFLSSYLGRKRAMLVAVFVFLVGSVVQTCAGIHTTELTTLYLGRAIGGFGVGLISAVVPTYISESAPREIRGRCVAAYQLFNVTGIMLAYWINYGLDLHVKPDLNPAMWRTSFGLQMLPGVICGALLLTQPESPRWLTENGRYDQALRTIARLRGAALDDPSVLMTAEEIRRDFELKPKLPVAEQVRFAFGSGGTMFYRSCIGAIVMFFQQWTGTNSVNYYTPRILKTLGLTNAGLFGTGLYGVVKVVATSLALAIAVEQLGRKRSLIGGAIAQSGCMYWVGIYQAIHGSAPTDGWSYTAVVALYLYGFSYSFGWGTVPWMVASETVPNQIRPLTMGLALMSQWLFNFTIARLTPVMLDHIPNGGTFLIFGSCLIVMAVWAAFFIPETRGIPLEEVGRLFDGGFLGIVGRSIRHVAHPPEPPRDEETDYGRSRGGESDARESKETAERSDLGVAEKC